MPAVAVAGDPSVYWELTAPALGGGSQPKGSPRPRLPCGLVDERRRLQAVAAPARDERRPITNAGRRRAGVAKARPERRARRTVSARKAGVAPPGRAAQHAAQPVLRRRAVDGCVGIDRPPRVHVSPTCTSAQNAGGRHDCADC
jgi:hypothetical protein